MAVTEVGGNQTHLVPGSAKFEGTRVPQVPLVYVVAPTRALQQMRKCRTKIKASNGPMKKELRASTNEHTIPSTLR